MRIIGMWKRAEMRVVKKNRKDGWENCLVSGEKVVVGSGRTNRRPPIPIQVPTRDSQNSPNPLPLLIQSLAIDR
jgi:hypothetical protein